MENLKKIVFYATLLTIVILSLGICLYYFLYNPIPEYLGLPGVFDETRTQNALRDICLYTIVEFANYILLILITIIVALKSKNDTSYLKYFYLSLIVITGTNVIIEIIKYQKEYLRYASQAMNVLQIMTVAVTITFIISIILFIKYKKESKYI